MTRLSNLHAYPAMIPDSLATDLTAMFVRPDDRMLDPFCGSGRLLLAAAERGARCVGFDVNPLATLLVTAKSTWVEARLIESTLEQLDSARLKRSKAPVLDLEPGRKVRWFSTRAALEIREVIDFLNRRLLHPSLLPLAAAVLSATVREVSYCRKDQWKLHRMAASDRCRWRKSAWFVFCDRFRAALKELASCGPLLGSCLAIRNDARKLLSILANRRKPETFDVVITSPPYGDSQTTVQYGGMSGLSLGVLRHLQTLSLDAILGVDIDRFCLGGDQLADEPSLGVPQELYWHGGRYNRAKSRVIAFAHDLEACCSQLGIVLRKGGLAVFVVARRSAGGWRVYLDKLLITLMRNAGMRLIDSSVRQIPRKVTPFLIHRRGRAQSTMSNHRDLVPTMREEFVLVFRRI